MHSPFRPTGWILLLGSLTLLLALVAIFVSVRDNQQQISQLTQAGRELGILHTLVTTSANRGNLLLHALASQDPFERDHLISQFRMLARNHLAIREQLQEGFLRNEMQTLLTQAQQLSNSAAQALNQLADNLSSDSPAPLSHISPDISEQHLGAIALFQQLSEKQNQHVNSLLQQASDERSQNIQMIALLVILSFANLLLALRFAQKLEKCQPRSLRATAQNTCLPRYAHRPGTAFSSWIA